MALGDLIHAYEAETNPLPEIDPCERSASWSKSMILPRHSLPSKTGLDVTTITEILNGEREFSDGARESMAKRFRVCPSLFA